MTDIDTTNDAEPQGAIDPMVGRLVGAVVEWTHGMSNAKSGREQNRLSRQVNDLADAITARLAAHDQSDRSEGERVDV